MRGYRTDGWAHLTERADNRGDRRRAAAQREDGRWPCLYSQRRQPCASHICCLTVPHAEGLCSATSFSEHLSCVKWKRLPFGLFGNPGWERTILDSVLGSSERSTGLSISIQIPPAGLWQRLSEHSPGKTTLLSFCCLHSLLSISEFCPLLYTCIKNPKDCVGSEALWLRTLWGRTQTYVQQ